MRVADYITRTLADRGVTHVFHLAGGLSMHLTDALARESRIRLVHMQHECAAAMAAEGYARVSGKVGVVCISGGPAALNALNGVFGAWTDSVPLLVLSGTCKRETLRDDNGLDIIGAARLRQLGDQEADIVSMARAVTKSAVCCDGAPLFPMHLYNAMCRALLGRPGPSWLDIPVDVQGKEASAAWCSQLRLTADPCYKDSPPPPSGHVVADVLRRLQSARRPVILAGSGVRIAGCVPLFREVIDRLGIPVATAWTHDTIPSDHPLFVGRQGTIGDRAGNFAVQNADVLLILGSRLCIRQVSYAWRNFAPRAFKIWIDVDAAELDKPTVKPDLPVHCDLRVFLGEMKRQTENDWSVGSVPAGWFWRCQEWKARYLVVQPHHREWRGAINPYHFLDTLWSKLAPDDVVVTGDALACIATFQTAKIKDGQRLFSNSGSASMGYGLPAAIGAAFAHGKRVICIEGDGSIQQNVQELQTIRHHNLPVKIFVLNNGGYASIRATQTAHFGRTAGTDAESGVSFPDIVRIAMAYGIDAATVQSEDFGYAIDLILDSDGPFLCEVMLDREQGIEPRLASRRLPDSSMQTDKLEDMTPKLPRDELAEAMRDD